MRKINFVAVKNDYFKQFLCAEKSQTFAVCWLLVENFPNFVLHNGIGEVLSMRKCVLRRGPTVLGRNEIRQLNMRQFGWLRRYGFAQKRHITVSAAE